MHYLHLALYLPHPPSVTRSLLSVSLGTVSEELLLSHHFLPTQYTVNILYMVTFRICIFSHICIYQSSVAEWLRWWTSQGVNITME